MTESESLDLVMALVNAAETRKLTTAEVFLIGQALSLYRQAIEARMLGRKGRYFVISEEQVDRMIKESGV